MPDLPWRDANPDLERAGIVVVAFLHVALFAVWTAVVLMLDRWK